MRRNADILSFGDIPARSASSASEVAGVRRQPSDWAKRDWRRPAGIATPGDPAKAEAGVRIAYAAAGLGQPDIIWCDGPVALADAWARAVGRLSVGANVLQKVWAAPCRAAIARLDARAGADAERLHRRLIRDPWRIVSSAIESAVMEAIGDVRPPLLTWMSERGRIRGILQMGRRPTFEDCGVGPYDLHAASLLAGASEAMEGDAGGPLVGLRLIAENTGWLMPHVGACWLSRRADVVTTDAQFRLHGASGPALRYPDGWGLHAWKGNAVPRWIVEQPDRITLPWIDAQIDPKVRHAMIDIFTPQRFVAANGAQRAANDDLGVLWKRTWAHRGVVIDQWAAVELTGRPEVFFTVPTDVATPHEGIARALGPAGIEALATP